jgi:hypothetical protein
MPKLTIIIDTETGELDASMSETMPLSGVAMALGAVFSYCAKKARDTLTQMRGAGATQEEMDCFLRTFSVTGSSGFEEISSKTVITRRSDRKGGRP